METCVPIISEAMPANSLTNPARDLLTWAWLLPGPRTFSRMGRTRLATGGGIISFDSLVATNSRSLKLDREVCVELMHLRDLQRWDLTRCDHRCYYFKEQKSLSASKYRAATLRCRLTVPCTEAHMRVMGRVRIYPTPLWMAWATDCLVCTCGGLATYTCFATCVGSISKSPSTFAIFPRKHVLKLESYTDSIRWLEISTESTPCLVHRIAHRAEIPSGSGHGLRNVTAVRAEI